MGKKFFVKDEREDDLPDGESKVDRLARVEEIMAFVKLQFVAAKTLPEADFTLSTREVYERLQKHYPTATYGRKDIFDLLGKLGYTYVITDEMHFHWLFKEARETQAF